MNACCHSVDRVAAVFRAHCPPLPILPSIIVRDIYLDLLQPIGLDPVLHDSLSCNGRAGSLLQSGQANSIPSTSPSSPSRSSPRRPMDFRLLICNSHCQDESWSPSKDIYDALYRFSVLKQPLASHPLACPDCRIIICRPAV